MPNEPRESETQEPAAAVDPAQASTVDVTPEHAPEAANAAADAIEGVVEGDIVDQDAPAEPAADPAVVIAELQAALEAEKARAEENYQLALRTKAEMENLRKRSTNEVDKARKFALEKFAGEVVGVRDSLEMGLDAANKDDADVASIREGTELTLKMFTSALEKFAVQEVNPQGEAFNPELHQAMGMQENPDVAPNTVMVVMQKGYTLNGRLLRPAMVMVSKS